MWLIYHLFSSLYLTVTVANLFLPSCETPSSLWLQSRRSCQTAVLPPDPFPFPSRYQCFRVTALPLRHPPILSLSPLLHLSSHLYKSFPFTIHTTPCFLSAPNPTSPLPGNPCPVLFQLFLFSRFFSSFSYFITSLLVFSMFPARHVAVSLHFSHRTSLFHDAGFSPSQTAGYNPSVLSLL